MPSPDYYLDFLNKHCPLHTKWQSDKTKYYVYAYYQEDNESALNDELGKVCNFLENIVGCKFFCWKDEHYMNGEVLIGITKSTLQHHLTKR